MTRPRPRGFTLIELMVALAVFALAAMALVRLQSATIRGAGLLADTQAAQMVARTIAIEAVTDAVPPPRGRTGGREPNGGRVWTWTREVQPLGDAGAVRVDVAVLGPAGNVAGRVTMVGR